jgi:hypothetical protein
MGRRTSTEVEETVNEHGEVLEDTLTNVIGIEVPVVCNEPVPPKDVDPEPERDESSGIQN